MADVKFSTTDLIKKGSESVGFDPKKGAKWFVTLGLLAIAGLAFYAWILPLLLTVVWGTVELIGAAICVMALGMVGIAFKRNVGYFTDVLTRLMFGWVIDFDPFVIQWKQINRAEKDLDKMVDEQKKIEGKYIELSQDLKACQEGILVSAEAEKIARAAGDRMGINDSIAEAMRCQQYVDSVGPIVKDMEFIITFVKEGKVILKNKIKNAKADLKLNQKIFESAKSGASALERMRSAMVGDIELNDASERAQANVMKNIALSIGQMRTSMEIISDVTREENLKSSANMSLARKKLQALNLVEGESYPMPTASANFKGIVKISDTTFPID